MLFYSFGAVGECLFHLDIAANPADWFYFDIIINRGGLDGYCKGLARAAHHPCRQLTVGVLVAQDIAVAPMLVFAQSARCVSAMAIIAGASGDCITDISGFADMGWQNCPPKIANGNAAGR